MSIISTPTNAVVEGYELDSNELLPHLTTWCSPNDFIQPKTEHTPALRPYGGWVVIQQPRLGEPGCQYSCLYCNQAGMDAIELLGEEVTKPYISQYRIGTSLNMSLRQGRDVIASVSAERLFDDLEAMPTFDSNSWIVLGNFADPSLDQWHDTLILLEGLANRGHRGPVSFITKGGIAEPTAARIADRTNGGLKVIAHISYSNMPEKIEPIGNSARLRTLERLADYGVPTIVSIRPIIPGINDQIESLNSIFRTCRLWSQHFVSGGIFVVNELERKLSEVGQTHEIPAVVGPGLIYHHRKYRSISHEELSALASRFNVMYHGHSSCAVAHIMTDHYHVPTWPRIPAYVDITREGHVANNLDPSHGTCHLFCTPNQISICASRRDLSPEQGIALLKEELQTLGYPDAAVIPSIVHKGAYFVAGESLPLEELFPIMERTGLQVDNLPNISQLLWGANKRSVEHMDLNVENYFLGACLVGQSWYIFVDQDEIDSPTIRLLEQWIRNETKARVSIVTIQDAMFFSVRYQDLFFRLDQTDRASFRAGMQEIIDVALDPGRREALRDQVRNYITALNKQGPYQPISERAVLARYQQQHPEGHS